MEDERFFALCSIIQYYRHARGRIPQKDIATHIGVDEHFFNNFMAGLSREHRQSDIEKISNYFQGWLDGNNGAEYLNSPIFIQRAAETVYPLQFGSERIGNIMRRLADDKPEAVKLFNRNYVGVYDLWRHSAHQDARFKPLLHANGTKSYWVSHAALQIFPAPSAKRYPRFQIRYRACKRTDAWRPANTIEGEVVVIHQYMYFLGAERSSGYPLMIVANYNAEVSNTFKGIALRNNVNSHSMFAARVTFIKNSKAKAIEDLDADCYVELDTDIADKIESFRYDIINNVDFDGRGGLVL